MHSDAGERPMAAGNCANTRYSELVQITRENAGRLTLAFTFTTGVVRGHEAGRSSSARRCTS